VSDDRERIRQIQDRLADLQRDNQASDAQALSNRADHPSTASPVAPARQRGKRHGWPFILCLLVIVFVFGELALTVQGYSGSDFNDATRVGHANVVSCKRRGPIGLGFGYWDQCTADIRWDGGFTQRHTFNRRNFLHADEVGQTVTVGQGTGFRGGGTTYSRPELPHRPLVVAAGVILAITAGIPALLLLATLLFAVRDGIRRRPRH